PTLDVATDDRRADEPDEADDDGDGQERPLPRRHGPQGHRADPDHEEAVEAHDAVGQRRAGQQPVAEAQRGEHEGHEPGVDHDWLLRSASAFTSATSASASLVPKAASTWSRRLQIARRTSSGSSRLSTCTYTTVGCCTTSMAVMPGVSATRLATIVTTSLEQPASGTRTTPVRTRGRGERTWRARTRFDTTTARSIRRTSRASGTGRTIGRWSACRMSGSTIIRPIATAMPLSTLAQLTDPQASSQMAISTATRPTGRRLTVPPPSCRPRGRAGRPPPGG